jgi:cold shock CspA family protein
LAKRPRGAVPKPAPSHKPRPTGPPEQRGVPSKGHVSKLFVGQGYGFIRLTDGRDVFFHRRDVLQGTSFNALAVGDAVAFELLEDNVSGARAVRVKGERRQTTP